MTYLTDCPYIAERVTLVNGYRAIQNGSLRASFYYDGHYVYGDFNHDNLKDAAVIVSGGEGNVNSRSVTFLISDGRRLVHRASHDLGDSVIINSLKEQNHKVVVDMFVHQESDCRAGPTKRVKRVYDYLNPNPDLISSVWIRPPEVLAHGSRELRDIYNTSIPTQIRSNFDHEVRVHVTCPECEWGALNGEQFIDLYSKKFLVVRVSPNDFGVWAVIAVEGELSNAFRLLLFNVDDDGYDLISIEELSESLEEGLARQIESPEYRQYWL